MRSRSVVWWALAFASAVLACSSSSSNGGGSGDGGGGGTATFSCSQGSDLCTQVVGPPSIQSAEKQACDQESGTFAAAPCPTAGSLGCCSDNTGETQCAYSQDEVQVLQPLCNDGKTWSGPDGGSPGDGGSGGDAGASGPAAFVGTWARSGTSTITCPTGNPTTNAITGNLVIALGSGSAALVATQPDGCQSSYTVSGNVATAAAGQSCNITTEAGVAETITITSHTLTLSADGKTLDSQGTATIDKTATGTTCTDVTSGTFTKQ